jgi:hypothetical protein
MMNMTNDVRSTKQQKRYNSTRPQLLNRSVQGSVTLVVAAVQLLLQMFWDAG